MYIWGETVLPVWPTWNSCSLQPASTAALEAPTAAPKTSAKSSRRAKLSGPFMPLPPETMISASVSSGRPVTFCTISFTRVRMFSSSTLTSTSTISGDLLPTGSPAPSAFARMVAITGL